jgi:hypothetical protein
MPSTAESDHSEDLTQFENPGNEKRSIVRMSKSCGRITFSSRSGFSGIVVDVVEVAGGIDVVD